MFAKKDVQVYGVSVGSQEEHAKFRAHLALPFPLLVDEGAKVSQLYDSVVEHEGKQYSARKLVLVDRTGKVAYRDDKYQVGDEADFAALRAAVEAL
jgi:peroxiredoxin Q/BCP